MDFHSLSRRDLQALCKKNKIPANITNIAMADALTALADKVEGLDEVMNPPHTDLQQSPEKTIPNSFDPETSLPLTRSRRTTRRAAAGDKDAILPVTPAVPPSRRRAPATSTRRKVSVEDSETAAAQQEKVGDPETPAIQSSRRRASAAASRKKTEAQKEEESVLKVYTTRRSVRILEKSMTKLSLNDSGSVEPVKMNGLCQEVEDVCDKKNVSESEMLDTPEETVNQVNDCEVQSFHNLDQSAVEIEGEANQVTEGKDNKSGACELVEDYSTKLEMSSENCENSHVVSCQTMDHSQSIEGGLSYDVTEHKQSKEHEVADCSSELEAASQDCTNLHYDVTEHKQSKEHEVADCSSELEAASQDCTNLHNALGLEGKNEHSDEGQEVDSHESTEENGPTAAALSSKIEETFSKEDALVGAECGDSPNNTMETEQAPIHYVSDAKFHNILGEESDSNPLPPVDFSNEKSKAIDESKTFNEISDHSTAIIDQAAGTDHSPEEVPEGIPVLPEDLCKVKSGTINESECSEISEFFNATDDEVVAGDNSLIVEPKMESNVAIEVKEPDMISSYSDDTPKDYESLVDNQEMYADDKFPASERETPTPAKQATPSLSQAARVLSPYAANTLQGQFPRPSEPMPKATSAKKQAPILSGINKENIDYGSGEVLKLKKDEADRKDNLSYDAMSLRTLQKMLKQKLQISKKSSAHEENLPSSDMDNEENACKQEGKGRIALQPRNDSLPEQGECRN
ncbi:hypothetical protein Tsubulata_010972 [Turnera subulata]|uniref:Uncharacterized protein n=1 Tax=Turnera subulata TaxID=218843 RepID=A0A9Q0GCP6_9ROSI|nr:hypothetical protein Tsubulata_010972 [Turnera subulata]